MKSRFPFHSIRNQNSIPLLVLVFFSLLIPWSFSQESRIRFERLSLEQGLSQASIICMLQDRKGFMWFGTRDGLNRYDGYRFKTYQNDPDDPHSLSGNFITVLLEDSRGFLWVGTDEGLNRFDPEWERFYHYSAAPGERDALSHNEVISLLEDQHGTLWVGTANGLNWIRSLEEFCDLFTIP